MGNLSDKEINNYNKTQFLLTSNRVVLLSKKEDIILNSMKKINFSSNDSMLFTVGKGSKDKESNFKLVINSPKIELGLNAKEPLVRGNKLYKLLSNLLTELQSFSTTLSSAQGIGIGVVSLVQINIASSKLMGKIGQMSQQLESIRSEQNFTI